MTPEQQAEWERLAQDPSMSAWNTVERATAFPDVVAALREAQATVERVRELADEWKASIENPKRRVGWSGGAILADLRRALDGKQHDQPDA